MTGLNYANRNLQNHTFRGQDLTGADFSNADLRGCDLTGAALVGANLQGILTGQTRRQASRLLLAAIAGPFLFLGSCFLIAVVLTQLIPEAAQPQVFGILGLLVTFSQIFWWVPTRERLGWIATALDLFVLSTLFALMAWMTLGLAFIVFSNAGSGWLLLVLLGLVAICWRLWQWLADAIQRQPGTLLGQANLTDANLSLAQIQNTDFSGATLTGICIAGWSINRYTTFDGAVCEYVYVGSDRQQRQPETGEFQPGQLEQLLTRFLL